MLHSKQRKLMMAWKGGKKGTAPQSVLALIFYRLR
jgi:hypothetical protein